MNRSHVCIKIIFIYIFLFISLFLTLNVYAEECDYYDIETFYEYEKLICMPNSQISKGRGLILSDFVDGEFVSFIAYNPNDFDLTVTFEFYVGGFLNETITTGTIINSKNYKTIRRPCINRDDEGILLGNCSLDINSLTYRITRPEILYPCRLNVEKNIKVCNKKCFTDYDCETTICNIGGYCGEERIVPCTEPKKNCNNLRCIVPYSKYPGELYDCEWECSHIAASDGICKAREGDECSKDIECYSGNCNFLGYCGEAICLNGKQNCKDMECRTPGVLKNGEIYLCEWECKSGVGKEGVCKENLFNKLKSWFILITISLILIVGIIYYLIYLKKRKFDFLNIEIKKMNNEKNKLQDEIKEYEKKIIRNKEDIKKLKDKANNAKGRVKEIIQNEINNLINENDELKNLIEEKQENKDKLIKIIENRHSKLFDKYYLDLQKIAGRDKIDIDGEGYPIFKSNGRRYHNWFYEGQYYRMYRSEPKGEEIHHIDYIKSNSYNFWNLIDLKPEEHKLIKHNRIAAGDWLSGIEELLRALNWKKDDLPKHIKEHLYKIEKDHKLDRFINEKDKEPT
jgi:hypothetical protein